MIFTLQRYIFRETFRVFVLAAVALTLILSLGMILRPVQEYGVGPRQVIHLMGYFLPITLTFVLPMAALFAAALVYGRFAGDNELDACRASGISLLTLVYPGLALAVMVAIANLILSFHVVPAFVHRTQKSLKADAKQILFRNIQRRGYYKVPPDERYLIYADQADAENDVLRGVTVAEVKAADIRRIITAESAKVRFSSHKHFSEVLITAYRTYRMDPEGETASAEVLSLTTEFGSLLGDDIKFKKVDEMKRVRAEPMRFYPIAKLARETYAQFTAELLAQDIAGTIAGESGEVERFYKLHSAKKLIEFRADACTAKDGKRVELLGEVVVLERDVSSRSLLSVMRCPRAFLHIEGDELAPTLTMELFNAAWEKPDGSEGLSRRPVIRGLILPGSVTGRFETSDVLEMVSVSSTDSALGGGGSVVLDELQAKLGHRIWKTFAEIKAEMHSRLVFGTGCVPMVLIGIALGIILKSGHQLTAFAASCIPAGVLMLCMIMGRNVTKNIGAQAVSGIILMWMGFVVLIVLTVVLYQKLLRN
jgi:lipopolysaccharide export LptBFGC system permease protein LptF